MAEMMDATVKNNETDEVCEADKKFLEFFKLHFEPNEGMYSNVILGCRRWTLDYVTETKQKMKSGVYNFKYIKTNEADSKNKIIQSLRKTLKDKADYYITQNGFTSPFKRDSDHVFTLHNIVVDIDCRLPKYESKRQEHAINSCRYFLGKLFEEHDFPTPNTIVETGRGLQIWWAIEPLPFSLKYMYTAVRKKMIERIQEILMAVETLHCLKVDMCASHNYAGYFRMPGSYNTKAKKYSTYEIINYDKIDIPETFWGGGYAPEKTGKQFKKWKKCKEKKFNLLDHRERMVYGLKELRGFENEKGFRDLMCLVVYNAYLSLGKEEEVAWEATWRLNMSFAKPLPEKELRNYMRTSQRKKYKFSNAKIIDFLQINEEEQKILNFFSVEKKKKEAEKKKKKKEERNQMIVSLANAGKMTMKEIAKIVGCAANTVSNVLKAVAAAAKKSNVVNIDSYRGTMEGKIAI